MRLIWNVIYVFFVVVFAMVRRGVDVVKWTVLQIMLGFRSFTVFTAIIRAKGFEMAGSLTLVAYALPHIWGKDFVDEE
jgi:hypothetical protein